MIRRNAATVDLSVIADNFRRLRAAAGPGGDAVAVVKANAYGHGLVPVARACAGAGARFLAVAALSEALALRDAALDADILLLAPLLPEDAVLVAREGFVPFLSSPEFLDALVATGIPTRCFLAVDTGMGREGFAPEDARRAFERAPDTLRFVGISTHLASADEGDLAHTRSQCAAFAQFVATLGPRADGLWRSVENSPGTLRDVAPGAPRLTRPGALLYGIPPYDGALEEAGVRAALTWQARLTLLRELPAGACVGYGRTAVLTAPARIATIAAGYGDGLSRGLSNRGVVLVRGVRCPIVGRVSMDQTQIDVTAAEGARVGDLATLIGPELPVEVMARTLETTCHEPTTTLSARVERLYTGA